MKTVVFNSPYLDVASFPLAQVTLERGKPALVTDEQADVLLKNPDVTIATLDSDTKAAAPVAAPAPIAAPATATSTTTTSASGSSAAAASEVK
jgi:hypothetical protein